MTMFEKASKGRDRPAGNILTKVQVRKKEAFEKNPPAPLGGRQLILLTLEYQRTNQVMAETYTHVEFMRIDWWGGQPHGRLASTI